MNSFPWLLYFNTIHVRISHSWRKKKYSPGWFVHIVFLFTCNVLIYLWKILLIISYKIRYKKFTNDTWLIFIGYNSIKYNDPRAFTSYQPIKTLFNVTSPSRHFVTNFFTYFCTTSITIYLFFYLLFAFSGESNWIELSSRHDHIYHAFWIFIQPISMCVSWWWK